MRGRRAALGFTVVVAVAAACGGSTSTIGDGDGGTGGGTGDGGASNDGAGGGDSGCTSPEPDSGAGTGNVCCDGFWQCDPSTNTWRHEFPGCACQVGTGGDAGSFACGTTTCSGAQYCQRTVGGAQPVDGGVAESDSCQPLPGSCGATPTCACVSAAGACRCNAADGHLTVTCDVP